MSYFNYNGKKLFFSVSGKGMPIVFLHGNTGSTKMFELLKELYEDTYSVVLFDFLGNGQSERVTEFPDCLWIEEGKQTVALLEHLSYPSVHLVGSSGGAYAAINAGLMRPELIGKIVADSFSGRTLPPEFLDFFLKDRQFAINDPEASQFYEWCQGDDWRQVVAADTKALVKCVKENQPLYCKDFISLENPLFLLGSKKDQLTRLDLEAEFQEICRLKSNASYFIFEEGIHPALLSNAEAAADKIKQFLE